jgi:hypothetical protein
MTQGAPRSAATLGRLTASRSGAVIAVHNAAKRPSQRAILPHSEPRAEGPAQPLPGPTGPGRVLCENSSRPEGPTQT